MMKKFTSNKPYKLDFGYNIRDLGGYAGKNGLTIKRNKLIRAEATDLLSDRDVDFLISIGLRTVVDLRSQYEREVRVSKLFGHASIDYFCYSMLDNIRSSGFVGGFPASMGALYSELLENYGSTLAAAISKIINSREAVMFNCSAGKDRTGVVAMLLLALCGVEPEQIFIDFSVSEQNLLPVVEKQKVILSKTNTIIPEYIFSSDPAQLKIAYNLLCEKYGGAYEYLINHGVKPSEIESFIDYILE